MFDSHPLRNGGPCCCAPGRYVRFTLPKVPGIPEAIVSCQDNDSPERRTIREHAIPTNAHIEIRLPNIERAVAS